jgi:hypothetical protein
VRKLLPLLMVIGAAVFVSTLFLNPGLTRVDDDPDAVDEDPADDEQVRPADEQVTDPATEPTPSGRDRADDERTTPEPPPLLEVGLAVEGLSELDDWIETVGVTPDVLDIYVSWEGTPDFEAEFAELLAERGVVLKITWEPWIMEGGVAQPQYSLSSIIGGEHDAYLRRWAEQIDEYGDPVILRPMHEMNGGWYPWGAGVNGNQPGEFVEAWRHIRAVFDEVGASNVTWEWAPNQLFEGTAELEPLFPGDDLVDRIGISAYNWGDEYEQYHRWRDFPELMGPTVEAIRGFTDASIGVAETASSSVGGDKAAWLDEMFTHALAEGYAFLSYFNLDTHRDWSVDGESDYRKAFVEGFERTRAPSAGESG